MTPVGRGSLAHHLLEPQFSVFFVTL